MEERIYVACKVMRLLDCPTLLTPTNTYSPSIQSTPSTGVERRLIGVDVGDDGSVVWR